jgi:hypothetical protein
MSKPPGDEIEAPAGPAGSPDVVQLRNQAVKLAELERRVKQLEGEAGKPTPSAGGAAKKAATPAATASNPAWNLAALTDKEKAELWRELAAWFDQRVRDHALEGQVPRCWYRHGGFVAQLAALKSSWETAHGPSARPNEAVAWHDAFMRMADQVWPRYMRHNHRETDAAAERRQRDREKADAAEFERYVTEEL